MARGLTIWIMPFATSKCACRIHFAGEWRHTQPQMDVKQKKHPNNKKCFNCQIMWFKQMIKHRSSPQSFDDQTHSSWCRSICWGNHEDRDYWPQSPATIWCFFFFFPAASVPRKLTILTNCRTEIHGPILVPISSSENGLKHSKTRGFSVSVRSPSLKPGFRNWNAFKRWNLEIWKLLRCKAG